MGRGPLATDGELLTADRRIAEGVLDRVCHRALDVDEREVVEELDRADHRPRYACFIGDGSDEVAGSQAGPPPTADPELLPAVRFGAARGAVNRAAATAWTAWTAWTAGA